MNPIITIVSSVEEGPVRKTVLAFEEVPYRPVSPAWIGWPAVDQPGPETKHVGRLTLHRLIALDGVLATFETESEPNCTPPPVGMRCTYYRWWDENQLELARDRARVWTLLTFQSMPSIRFPSKDGAFWTRALEPGEAIPAGAALIEGGWDHEHCCLCWQTISDGADGQPMAHCSDQHWMCIECHERYLATGFGQLLGDQD